jgi:hypothetical protein
MNPPEKEKERVQVPLSEPRAVHEPELPPELREKMRNATKKEKNDIMRFYYEYVI